jgi:hypothetical protein
VLSDRGPYDRPPVDIPGEHEGLSIIRLPLDLRTPYASSRPFAGLLHRRCDFARNYDAHEGNMPVGFRQGENTFPGARNDSFQPKVVYFYVFSGSWNSRYGMDAN